jgi:hypothetical protein
MLRKKKYADKTPKFMYQLVLNVECLIFNVECFIAQQTLKI